MSIRANTKIAKLTRPEIAAILARHKYSAQIARDLSVSKKMISLWLQDKTNSRRVEEACRASVVILLDKEKNESAGASHGVAA